MTESVDIAGGRIAYDVTGSGPLVVLSHGIGDRRQDYRFLAPMPAQPATGWPARTCAGAVSPAWAGSTPARHGLAARTSALTAEVNALEKEIAVLAPQLAPSLLALPGAAELTVAKIVSQTVDVRRFRSRDAYARHNGTAPLPVWSGNRVRHRPARTGNRQLNCAIHRIAVTQIRCHPQAQAYFKARMNAGDTQVEALRALKRRLSDIVYRALLADGTTMPRSQAA